MTETERQIGKEKIISELNGLRLLLDARYPDLDGTKYLRSLPIDPFGRKIDMPKDKFPEWYKWNEDNDLLFEKYNQLIEPFVKYKIGDVAIFFNEDKIEFGIIHSTKNYKNCLERYIGRYSKHDEDIEYTIIQMSTTFNGWKHGCSGECGSYGLEVGRYWFFNERNIPMSCTVNTLHQIILKPIDELKELFNKNNV